MISLADLNAEGEFILAVPAAVRRTIPSPTRARHGQTLGEQRCLARDKQVVPARTSAPHLHAIDLVPLHFRRLRDRPPGGEHLEKAGDRREPRVPRNRRVCTPSICRVL